MFRDKCFHCLHKAFLRCFFAHKSLRYLQLIGLRTDQPGIDNALLLPLAGKVLLRVIS